jgi:hypothetical protein
MNDEQIWGDNLTEEVAEDRADNIAKAISRVFKGEQGDVSILEIAAGNCEVMDQIQKLLPEARCVATDIRTIKSPDTDCYFLQIPVQEFIRQTDLYEYLGLKAPRINFVIILNSYRHWEDEELREQFDNWIKKTADYLITSFGTTEDPTWADKYESMERIGMDNLINRLYLCKVKK